MTHLLPTTHKWNLLGRASRKTLYNFDYFIKFSTPASMCPLVLQQLLYDNDDERPGSKCSVDTIRITLYS